MKSRILNEQESIPDFVKGSLVVRKDLSSCVILVTSDSSRNLNSRFEGVCICNNITSNIGTVYDNLVKDSYKRFSGEIQLTQ